MVRPVAHHRAARALRFLWAHERAQLRRVLRRRGMAHAGDGGHLARRGEAPRPRHGDGLAHDRVPPRDRRGAAGARARRLHQGRNQELQLRAAALRVRLDDALRDGEGSRSLLRYAGPEGRRAARGPESEADRGYFMRSPVWPWRVLASRNSSPPMVPLMPELLPGSRVPVRTTGSLCCTLAGSFVGAAHAPTAAPATAMDNSDRMRIFLSSLMV